MIEGCVYICRYTQIRVGTWFLSEGLFLKYLGTSCLCFGEHFNKDLFSAVRILNNHK